MELRLGRLRRLVWYRVANPGWRIVPNRYGEKSIGVGFVLWRWCLSIVWGRP